MRHMEIRVTDQGNEEAQLSFTNLSVQRASIHRLQSDMVNNSQIAIPQKADFSQIFAQAIQFLEDRSPDSSNASDLLKIGNSLLRFQNELKTLLQTANPERLVLSHKEVQEHFHVTARQASQLINFAQIESPILLDLRNVLNAFTNEAISSNTDAYINNLITRSHLPNITDNSAYIMRQGYTES